MPIGIGEPISNVASSISMPGLWGRSARTLLGLLEQHSSLMCFSTLKGVCLGLSPDSHREEINVWNAHEKSPISACLSLGVPSSESVVN